jgi:trimeric autotransporter adhesin
MKYFVRIIGIIIIGLVVLIVVPIFCEDSGSYIKISGNWSAMAICTRSIIALRPDGSLWFWGLNGDGQLGDPSKITVEDSPVRIGNDDDWITIGANGANSMVLLKKDGSLWTCGYNDYGQLGDGSYKARYVPTRIGTDTNWLNIAVGRSNTFALKKDGSLWAWGYNKGVLGDGTTINRTIPTRIGTDTNWLNIAASGAHTIALKKDGSLWGWGLNDRGQLGDGSCKDRYVPTRIGIDVDWAMIACGDYYTIALKKDGSLWGWGLNDGGQLGDGSYKDRYVPTRIGIDVDWAMIACGDDYTIALKKDGLLWAWGYNQFCQLRLSRRIKNKNTPIQIDNTKNWKTIAGGCIYTCAIKNDGTLWIWGSVGRD